MVFGTPLIELNVVDSTNKTAAELLAAGQIGHGAAILAHEQREGRGQRGRLWQSQPKLDITFSIVCKPVALKADKQFDISKVAALAVHDAVREQVQSDVRIKWPNDILIDGRKVAGILIQNELMGDRVVASIVGIGLNVNSAGFPTDLMATSLAIETGAVHDLGRVLGNVLGRFGHWWQKWQDSPDIGLESYSDRLWTRGRWSDMILDGQPISARALDVDPLGRLVVESADGRVSAYGLDRLRFAPRTTGLHSR